MLDLATTRGKIVYAAMRLAASEGWTGLSLSRIAAGAGVSLAEFRRAFRNKAQILAAFIRAVDDAVLAKTAAPDAGSGKRERLFDVLMTRLEIMAPYKESLRRIRNDLRFRPGESLALFGMAARSQYWMLAAAGVDVEGPKAAVYLPWLLGTYAQVFNIWLDDNDPGLGKTMASLDGRLRDGEWLIQRLGGIRAAAKRFCCGMVCRCGREKGPVSREPVQSDRTQSGGGEPEVAPGA